MSATAVISLLLVILGITLFLFSTTIGFGIICVGFVCYDLVGGWDLLNESLSRIGTLKENLFNIKENYSSYLSVPGTIKLSNVVDENLFYSGIWTVSMILTFTFAITGIQMSPNVSMLTFSSKKSWASLFQNLER